MPAGGGGMLEGPSAGGGGGGGGSNFTSLAATNVTVTNGVRSGNGLITVTYTTPVDPAEEIADLQGLVASMAIHHGITNALDSKLQHALDAFAVDDTAGACYWMQSFVDLVNAQKGKKLTTAQAQQLTDAANDIRTQLGC